MKPTLLIVFCLATTARFASAQTHQEAGMFVEGGAFATYEARSYSDTNLAAVIGIVAPADHSTTVPGGAVGVGVFLRPFLSVRADALFEGEAENSLYPSGILAGRQVTELLPTTVLASQEARTRTISVQTLLAYHIASSRRMRLAVLGGVSFDRHRTQLSSDLFVPALTNITGIGRTVPPQRFQYAVVDYNQELVVGVDGELAMGQHLALVPQFRAVGGQGSIRLQPGVNLRWRP